MINLQYKILNTLYEVDSMNYFDLINSCQDNPNSVHALLATMHEEGIISASSGIDKTRDVNLSLTSKGVLLLIAEHERRDFLSANDKKLLKQFKITQGIAFIAAIAVVVQAVFAAVIYFS